LTKKDLSDDQRAQFRQKLIEKYEQEASPYFTSARMMVDGILDPRNTRALLITGLEMAAHNPDLGEFKTGVMRM